MPRFPEKGVRVHKDSKGTVITEGQEVIYNRGGTLVKGTVIKVGTEIRVMADATDHGHLFTVWDQKAQRSVPGPVTPSRIKHGTTLYVVRRADGTPVL